ncbi:unnamed protein product, partial [Rotaria sp. Silwood1]
KKNNKASSSPSQEDEIEQLFENITCSNDFFKLKYLEINYQLDMITCIPSCAWKKQAPKHLLSSIKSSFGMFQHIEHKTGQSQSQKFRSLKTSYTNVKCQTDPISSTVVTTETFDEINLASPSPSPVDSDIEDKNV